ncbi:MAG: glutamine-hydrolyzing carbamoyl-phosphate synthase small subunit [Gammaproteobacteria bacterium]|nr:glutamine-hydrolyzing carbamoyl-phosphate synthase small subunit [Gammaproteobacteria bacterium]
MTEAILALEDGSIFRGQSIGVSGAAVGEVVFNTAMTGYQEILTDPSYARQLITFTYPHIGNTGVNEEDNESDRVWAGGLIIRDLPLLPSSWRMQKTLPEFLEAHKVVAIAGLDTRRLTRIIRERGAQGGCILAGHGADEKAVDKALEQARDFPGLTGMDLACIVSTENRYTWDEGGWSLESGYRASPAAGARAADTVGHHVVVFDFGVKRNMLRMLVDRGCRVTVVPARTTAQEVLSIKPDGVMLSNGPGDPDPCRYAIQAIEELIDAGVPTFGICLGYQLLALASGARTIKMSHGHHGANHPVKALDSDRVVITSQNHGFAVDGESLPACLEATHVSLFDGSLQGIRRRDRPAFGFQGHPEASPGPHDVGHLFDEFVAMMNRCSAEVIRSQARE